MVPRFAVELGTKEDGSRKLRAVDHMSWAARSTSGGKRKRSEAKKWSTNGCTSIPERIRHDHLDFVEESGRLFHETTGEVRAHLLKYIHPHVSAFMLGTRSLESTYRQCVSAAADTVGPPLGGICCLPIRWRDLGITPLCHALWR